MMTRTPKTALLVLTISTAVLLMASPVDAHAADAVQWLTGPQILTPQSAADAVVAIDRELTAGRSHVVVRLDGPVTADERQALADAGVKLLNPLGGYAWFANVDSRATQNAATPGNVTAVAPIEPEQKLHPTLLRGELVPWMIQSKKPLEDRIYQLSEIRGAPPVVAAYVLFHRDVAATDEGVALLHSHGGRVRSLLRSVNGAVVELPYDMLLGLTQADEVMWIEPPLPPLSEMNNSNRERTGADVAQTAPYNLDGTGVTVLVYDGGYALDSHPDFGGRLTVRDSSGLSDHATHVSGTIGGDGSDSSGLYRGMAPGVIIESYGFEQEGGLEEGFLYTDPGDLEQDYTEAINVYGADISNNSIGTNTAPNGYPCEWEGNYGVTGALIDSIVRGDVSGGAPFRIVWANGNERQTSRCFGIEGYPGEYHTTAPPACAKNHITVGAMNSNDDSVTSFTSWGPTDDGRIKPDISAPGCQSDDDFDVTSCSAYGGYTGKCGTSMSCPTVTGLGALLLQDYRDQYPGEPDFRNSTLKVLLAQTAVDLEEVGPDYKTGYGSVRVVSAIELMRSGHFFEAEVNQGGVYSAVVYAPAGSSEIRVTIAWDDPPGTPNVNPVLVNDLDLRVIGPDDTVYYPWTLNPASPSTPAVRTQPDHANNIEQVVIDAPAEGAYRIEVEGFNVPDGPQVFSLAGSPQLVNCSPAGMISLNGSSYTCTAAATVQVIDCDLNTDDNTVETVTINVASGSEPAGEDIVLTETSPVSAQFTGSLPLATTDATGTLLVTHGDTVTATYIDADDGAGGTNISVTDTATIDCIGPLVFNVDTTVHDSSSATVTFETDEATRATVEYGLNCGTLTGSVSSTALGTSHEVSVSELTELTNYYFAITAEDAAGNIVVDDNGGACYSFQTPEILDRFTESFSSAIDLDGMMLTFVPDQHPFEYYDGCVEPITDLPTDPAGGNVITLSDDSYHEVTLAGGETVELYGVTYSTFFIGSNGYITFTDGDSTYSESLTQHFSLPRISALFDDLNPYSLGQVSWKQLSDRVAVTWENVPEYASENSNTFQIELYFDGTITITYHGIDASDGIIVGLSDGAGLPPDFEATDLSALGDCVPPDCNGNGIPDVDDLANCDGSPWCSDCNGNGLLDECDIDSGLSEDRNTNGIPDECEDLPEVERVITLGATRIQVWFTKPLDEVSAETASNYAISLGALVHTAELLADLTTVELSVSGLSTEQTHILTINDVYDLEVPPNAILPDTQVAFRYGLWSRIEDDLVVLYTFDEGFDTTVYDVSEFGTPLDLTISGPSVVAWTDGGLLIEGSTRVKSNSAATKVVNACQLTDELTIETWIAPTNTTQTNLARIATLSTSNAARNFTFGQNADRYAFLLRTSDGEVEFESPAGTATTNLQHVIYTRSADGELKLYIDGQLIASSSSTGTFATWNSGYSFSCAGEPIGYYPWLGELRMVAVYNRALTQQEIDLNYWAGADSPPPPVIGDMNCDGLVDYFDINYFLVALEGEESWPYPDCPWLRGDCDENGAVDYMDINCFIELLGG